MDLTVKTVVLTGATTGIGRATALALADQPARLVIHGPQAAPEVSGLTHSLQAAMQPGSELTYLRSDYSDLASVVQLARDIRSSTDHIDALINNAARPGAPSRTLTSDGNEITFQTNYLAPVALTTLVLDLVGRDRPGRIVNVASATHLWAELPHCCTRCSLRAATGPSMRPATSCRWYPTAGTTVRITTSGGQRGPIPPPWTQSPRIASTGLPLLH